MNQDFDSKEYREAFVEEFIRTGMAFQIRALRKREDWSQAALAEKAEMKQNVISRLESPDYGNLTVNTLIRLAAAFDVALLVRFAPFSDLWRATQKLSPDDLAVPRYNDERNPARLSAQITATPVLTLNACQVVPIRRASGTAQGYGFAPSRTGTSQQAIAATS